jgi:adenylate cyclase
VFALQATAGFALEERSKRRIRQAFGQYISPVLVDQLTRAGTTPETGGDERPITVMFCDVRGFTGISEGFAGDPAGLTRLMNRYLTAVTDVVMAHGGTIDKYIGDAVMAFWNAPLDDPDHAANAVRAALAIEARIQELNDELRAEAAVADSASMATGRAGPRRSADPPRFRVGIGINTGRCLVGNLGSAQRFNYSALGDAVNVAARLEGETKTYSTTILAGETTVRHSRAAAVFIEHCRLRGREEPVEVYAVVGDEAVAKTTAFADLLAAHVTFVAARERGDLETAREALARCETLDLAPPGVYARLRSSLTTSNAASLSLVSHRATP